MPKDRRDRQRAAAGGEGTKALFADPGGICACTLTGCRNITPARKAGEYEVEVPGWGIRPRTARPAEFGVAPVNVLLLYE